MNSPDNSKSHHTFFEKKSKKDKEKPGKELRYKHFDEESIDSVEFQQAANSESAGNKPNACANQTSGLNTTLGGTILQNTTLPFATASIGPASGSGSSIVMNNAKSKKTKASFALTGKKKPSKKEKQSHEKEKKEEKKARKKRQKQLMEQVEEEKKPTRPVYGVELKEACQHSISHDGIPLPAFFRQFIDYIEENGLSTVGIYRVSGVKSKVQSLIKAVDHGTPIILSDFEPTVIASAIKTFLRELPEPVLTHKLSSKFDEASTLQEEKISVFRDLIGQLPDEHRYLLAWTTLHMNNVISKSRENQMTLQNVSVVLSPTVNISHRTLNVLFSHAGALFRDITLVKYVPPLRPAARLELPDTQAGIIEELRKQESYLSSLHAAMKEGYADEETEVGIWEVQRIVTQLKRKLTLAQLTSTEAINAELAKHQTQLDRLHDILASGNADKETEDELWEVQRTITMLKRKLKHTTASFKVNSSSAPKTVKAHGDQSSEKISGPGKPSENDDDDVVLNLTLRRVTMEDPFGGAAVPPPYNTANKNKKDDELPPRDLTKSDSPNEIVGKSESSEGISDSTLSSSMTTSATGSTISASGSHDTLSKPQSIGEEPLEEEPTIQPASTDNQHSGDSAQPTISSTDIDKIDELADDKWSSYSSEDDFTRRETTSGSQWSAELARTQGGTHSVSPSFVCSNLEDLIERGLMRADETDQLIPEDEELRNECIRVLYTAEELNAIKNDLETRLRQEKAEITRLRKQIELRRANGASLTSSAFSAYRTLCTDFGDVNSSDSSCADSSADEDDEENLTEVYRQLVWDNRRLEKENHELVERIYHERNHCVDLKVSLRTYMDMSETPWA